MLETVAVMLMALGAAVVYGAGYIVKRFSLDQRVALEEAGEIRGEALEEYKRVKALSLVRLVGFFLMLPGEVLAFIAFR